jgi:hypothetical protein
MIYVSHSQSGLNPARNPAATWSIGKSPLTHSQEHTWQASLPMVECFQRLPHAGSVWDKTGV